MNLNIRIVQLEHGKGLTLPQMATTESAGADLMAAIDQPLVIAPGQRVLVPCGFAMALDPGYEAQVRPRSGLALKYGVTVLNAPGTIDSDYRGEVKVLLINLGHEAFTIDRGMRIAQLVISRFERIEWVLVDEFDPQHSTERGSGGFGSTGIQAL